MLLATLGGVLLGLLGSVMPALLFWSEEEIAAIFRNEPLPHLYGRLVGLARLDTTSGAYLFGLATLKTVAMAVLLTAGWPGGVVFPLFFVGATCGLAVTRWLPELSAGIAVPCLISSIATAILRVPWSSCLCALLLATAPTRIIVISPIICIAAHVSLLLTRKLRFYPQQVQRSRDDVIPLKKRVDNHAPAADTSSAGSVGACAFCVCVSIVLCVVWCAFCVCVCVCLYVCR